MEKYFESFYAARRNVYRKTLYDQYRDKLKLINRINLQITISVLSYMQVYIDPIRLVLYNIHFCKHNI